MLYPLSYEGGERSLEAVAQMDGVPTVRIWSGGTSISHVSGEPKNDRVDG